MEMKIRIENMSQIRAAFRAAPGLMRKELVKGLNKAAFFIAGKAQQQLTSGRNRAIDTGYLRASIGGGFFSAGNRHGQGSFGKGTGVKLAGSQLTAEVGTNVEYAIYVHEGTRYMRARPFLRDAVDEAESKVQDFFTDAVQEGLNKVGRMT